MLIDEKGKLFGKINLLDLVIVLLIVLVLAGAAYLYASGGIGAKGETLPLRYTVEVTNKDEAYFAHIIEGEKVIDGVTKAPMGKIAALSTKPATISAQADDKMVTTTIPGKLDGYIEIEADAIVAYPDLMLEKQALKVGMPVAIRSESAALHGYVVEISYDEELLKEMK